MYLENDAFHVQKIESLAGDLYRLLNGYGTGGRVTLEGQNPDTGKTVRETLLDMRKTIDVFLAQ